MEAVAKLRNNHIAPRKMRMVVDTIRGKQIGEALDILRFQSKAGAPYVEKLLLSAIANWEGKNPEQDLEEADLFVKTVFVTGGRTLKRFQPAPQGRAHRIRKRSCHITLVIDSVAGDGDVYAEEVTEEENENA